MDLIKLSETYVTQPDKGWGSILDNSLPPILPASLPHNETEYCVRPEERCLSRPGFSNMWWMGGTPSPHPPYIIYQSPKIIENEACFLPKSTANFVKPRQNMPSGIRLPGVPPPTLSTKTFKTKKMNSVLRFKNSNANFVEKRSNNHFGRRLSGPSPLFRLQHLQKN